MNAPRKNEVERDDERYEPEGIINAHCVDVAEPAVDTEVVQNDVRRRVVMLEVMAVDRPVEGEGDPVGGHDAHQAAAHEGYGRLRGCPGAERQADAAEDHKNIHAEIAVEKILPDQDPAGVIENDEEDRQALEFVEHGQATVDGGRKLDLEFGHGGGDGLSISRVRRRRRAGGWGPRRGPRACGP